jgi:hypothetical protein
MLAPTEPPIVRSSIESGTRDSRWTRSIGGNGEPVFVGTTAPVGSGDTGCRWRITMQCWRARAVFAGSASGNPAYGSASTIATRPAGCAACSAAHAIPGSASTRTIRASRGRRRRIWRRRPAARPRNPRRPASAQGRAQARPRRHRLPGKSASARRDASGRRSRAVQGGRAPGVPAVFAAPCRRSARDLNRKRAPEGDTTGAESRRYVSQLVLTQAHGRERSGRRAPPGGGHSPRRKSNAGALYPQQLPSAVRKHLRRKSRTSCHQHHEGAMGTLTTATASRSLSPSP